MEGQDCFQLHQDENKPIYFQHFAENFAKSLENVENFKNFAEKLAGHTQKAEEVSEDVTKEELAGPDGNVTEDELAGPDEDVTEDERAGPEVNATEDKVEEKGDNFEVGQDCFQPHQDENTTKTKATGGIETDTRTNSDHEQGQDNFQLHQDEDKTKDRIGDFQQGQDGISDFQQG